MKAQTQRRTTQGSVGRGESGPWGAVRSELARELRQGIAALLCVPARLLGRRTVRAGRPIRSGQTDADVDVGTGLLLSRGLLRHGARLLADCRAQGGEFTLAIFDCQDLLEAREVYGREVGAQLLATVVARMELLAGSRGLAARTGRAEFAVALPLDRERAVQCIERVLGNPARIDLGGRSEIVLVPNVMVETVGRAESLEQLFAAMGRGLARVQHEEQTHQRYLERERERHSRPVSLPAALACAPADLPPARRGSDRGPQTTALPSTIPMPLSPR